jgi:superfamily II DNA or RNA helicase
MFSILSSSGYGILKSMLDDQRIKKIKDDLTMKPYKNFSMGDEEISFTIYRENEKRIYVPRYYGLQVFGLPTLNKIEITNSTECNLDFIGKLRDNQLEPVSNFLKAANDKTKMGGIISVPCGYGKTIMSLYIACQLKKKTMFISHKDFLNQQFIDTVRQFAPNARIGKIKQSKVDVKDKDIIIASLQSLSMREYPDEVFQDIGFVIIDEVHHTGAQIFSQAFRKLNHPIILGLSATLNRKDGMRKVFEYYIGKSVYTFQNKDNIEVNVHMHKYYVPHIDYSSIKILWNGKENISSMINNICNFKPRTEYIITILKEVLDKDPGRKILILSERRNQLKQIELYLELNKIIDYGYYVGGMKQDELNKSADKQIILATYQLASEGFNVPSLNTVIFASPISDIQQSIGRILRERPENRKYIPLCIDIWDEFSVFNNKAYTRMRYYNKNGYNIEYFQDNKKIIMNKNTDKNDVKKVSFIEDD